MGCYFVVPEDGRAHLRYQRVRRVQTQRLLDRRKLTPPPRSRSRRRRELEQRLGRHGQSIAQRDARSEDVALAVPPRSHLLAERHRAAAQTVQRLATQRRRRVARAGTTPGTRRTSRRSRGVDRRRSRSARSPRGLIQLAPPQRERQPPRRWLRRGCWPHEWNHPVDARRRAAGGGRRMPGRPPAARRRRPASAAAATRSIAESPRRMLACEPGGRGAFSCHGPFAAAAREWSSVAVAPRPWRAPRR